MPAATRSPRAARFRKRLAVEFGPALPLAHSGFTVNVSARGLRITSPFLERKGDPLVLQVRLADGELCRLEGRVKWTKPGNATLGIPNEFGVELSRSDERWYGAVAAAARDDGIAVDRRPAPAPMPAAPSTPPSTRKPKPLPKPLEPVPLKPAPTLEELRARPQVERAPRFRIALPVRFGTTRLDLSGLTQDVSEGGLSLETLSMRPVGTQVQLEVELPDGYVCVCRGEVVRVRAFGLLQRKPNALAVRFTEVDPAWARFIGDRRSA